MPAEIDKEHMIDVLDNFWKQCETASQFGLDGKINPPVNAIVIAGMGGSALPGEILRAYLGTKMLIYSCRDYNLPEWANKNTLVFCVSYSGNTEETLSTYKDARKRGCKLVCIASGGKLSDACVRDKVPFVRVPGGIQPRDAIGYMTIPILNILMASKIISKNADTTHVTSALKTVDKEKAQEIAKKLFNKIPIFYSSRRMAALAMIWKIKVNENAKCQAFFNVFPEMNHNEMVGFTHMKGDFYIIMMEDEEDSDHIKKRMEITKHLLQKQGCPVLLLKITGKNRLARIFSTLLLGAYVGYYLALEYKIDPSPVVMVEELKKMLASK
ncbi:bifunctional phosphoglucose/phosphomannose isomerase [Candidatus Woesearchaeota archaeon]|nr:bifunctional phosphoglucose/phosphomannose isomerase [Candidatus Woesearchaeota archaeon]